MKIIKMTVATFKHPVYDLHGLYIVYSALGWGLSTLPLDEDTVLWDTMHIYEVSDKNDPVSSAFSLRDTSNIRDWPWFYYFLCNGVMLLDGMIP